jgi:hypothetical protein
VLGDASWIEHDLNGVVAKENACHQWCVEMPVTHTHREKAKTQVNPVN